MARGVWVASPVGPDGDEGAILAFSLPWKITNFPIMSQCQRIAIGLGSECVYVAGGGSGRSGQCVSA